MVSPAPDLTPALAIRLLPKIEYARSKEAFSASPGLRASPTRLLSTTVYASLVVLGWTHCIWLQVFLGSSISWMTTTAVV